MLLFTLSPPASAPTIHSQAFLTLNNSMLKLERQMLMPISRTKRRNDTRWRNTLCLSPHKEDTLLFVAVGTSPFSADIDDDGGACMKVRIVSDKVSELCAINTGGAEI